MKIDSDILILYFSGTGNTATAAHLLAEKLHCDALPFIGGKLPERSISSNIRNIIWAAPVYAWGLPPLVEKEIRHLIYSFGEDAAHHLLLTCGDDIGLTHILWRKIMHNAGKKCGAIFSIQMPNTYVLLPGFDVDTPKKAEEKLALLPQRVTHIANCINDNFIGDDVTPGRFPCLKSYILRPLFHRFLMSPKPLHVIPDECIGCGICEKICPLHNIRLNYNSDRTKARPEWGPNCTLCLGCYHMCPNHAIAYGKITLKKGQKRIPKPY